MVDKRPGTSRSVSMPSSFECIRLTVEQVNSHRLFIHVATLFDACLSALARRLLHRCGYCYRSGLDTHLVGPGVLPSGAAPRHHAICFVAPVHRCGGRSTTSTSTLS